MQTVSKLKKLDSDKFKSEDDLEVLNEKPVSVKPEKKVVRSNSSNSDCELGDEDYFYRKQGQTTLGMGNNLVKLNKEEEEDLIRELENQALENDTLKELDQALMDRSTAQKTLRNKSQFLTQHAKINSSNFLSSNQEPAQLVKKLKLMSQQTNQPATPAVRNRNLTVSK